MSEQTKRRRRRGRGHIGKQRGSGGWPIVISRGYQRDPETGKIRVKQDTYTVHGTRKDAEKRLTELLSSIDEKKYVAPVKTTVGAWLRKWLDASIQPPRHSVNTVDTYKWIVEKKLVPALGHIGLQDLQELDVTQFVQSLKCSPKSARLYLTVLSSALKSAKKNRQVSQNVAVDVDGRPPMPRKNAGAKQNYWPDDDAASFMTSLATADAQTQALFACYLATGARRNELLGLRWSDVDLTKGVVGIERQLLRQPKRDATGRFGEPMWGPPKCKSNRVVTIDAETVRLLREHRRQQAEVKLRNRTAYYDYGLVFAREWPDLARTKDALGLPLSWDALAYRLDKLIKAAGVKRVTPHGFRHTFATSSLLHAVPVTDISKRLGHAQPSITLDVYSHAQEGPEAQQLWADKIGAVIHRGKGR